MGKLTRIARRVAGFLPVGSAAKYLWEAPIQRRDSRRRAAIKLAAHVIYGIIGTCWAMESIFTGELNPVEQWRHVHRTEIERREEWKKRSELYNEIFRPRGLADTNRNGNIDIVEKARAYELMNAEYRVDFSPPFIQELETAKELLEKEKRKKNNN